MTDYLLKSVEGGVCTLSLNRAEVMNALNHSLFQALEAELGEPDAVNIVWRPQTSTDVDEDKAGTLMKLVDALEDDDDVQNVYANFEISEEVLSKLTAA